MLGLRLLESRKGAARFDAGNLTIGNRQVDAVRGTSRVVTFRIEKGIEEFHEYLRGRGVKSKMIDMDVIGKVLSTEDMSGHLLWVHQPGKSRD